MSDTSIRPLIDFCIKLCNKKSYDFETENIFPGIDDNVEELLE